MRESILLLLFYVWLVFSQFSMLWEPLYHHFLMHSSDALQLHRDGYPAVSVGDENVQHIAALINKNHQLRQEVGMHGANRHQTHKHSTHGQVYP